MAPYVAYVVRFYAYVSQHCVPLSSLGTKRKASQTGTTDPGMCSAHAARVTCARISKCGESAGSFGPSTSKIKSPRSHISSFRSRTSTLPINVYNNTKFEDTLTLGNYRLKLHQAFVRGALLHPRITIKPPVPSSHLTSNFIR